MSQEIKENVSERTRKVDVDAMTESQIDDVSKAIGEKIGNEISAVTEKIKKMLQIYGLEIKMTYILHPIGENPLEVLAKEQEALAKEQAQA